MSSNELVITFFFFLLHDVELPESVALFHPTCAFKLFWCWVDAITHSSRDDLLFHKEDLGNCLTTLPNHL